MSICIFIILRDRGIDGSAQGVAEVLFARWAEVRTGAALQAAGGPALADFDWRVHALVASERLAHVRAARLVLDLQLRPQADGPGAAPAAAPLRLELTRPDLDRLLAALTACQAVCLPPPLFLPRVPCLADACPVIVFSLDTSRAPCASVHISSKYF